MSEDKGGCCCCSVFLFFVGAIFITFGVLFCYYPDIVMTIEPAIYYNNALIQLGLFQIDKIMIAAGFFMCLASICSCVSACTAFFHIIAFIIILVCIVIMSITLHDFNNEAIKDKIESNMKIELKSFDNSTTEKNIWSFIQQDLHCCGISNSSDWLENNYYANGSVPDSCCKNITNNCGESAGPDEIFQDGCLLLFEGQVFSHFWMVVVLLTALCIVGAVVACSCCFQIC